MSVRRDPIVNTLVLLIFFAFVMLVIGLFFLFIIEPASKPSIETSPVLPTTLPPEETPEIRQVHLYTFDKGLIFVDVFSTQTGQPRFLCKIGKLNWNYPHSEEKLIDCYPKIETVDYYPAE